MIIRLKMLVAIVAMSMMTGCLNQTAPIPEYVPDVPQGADEVLGYDYPEDDYTAESDINAPASAGILSKNIQNLLCNSVHHARNGRQDQAYQKLDMAKNDKLVKMLSKDEITQEQYLELDAWMADLIELLMENVYGYPHVERTFPFSCAGQDEETEVVGEVIELSVEEEVEDADRFAEKICHSTFAAADHDYIGAADFLVSADVLALQLLHSAHISEEYKNILRGWLHKIHQILIFSTPNYTSTNMPFRCEQYRATYTPSGLSSRVEDIVDVVVGIVRGAVDGIRNFFDALF